jgi:phosphatidylinositol phospholipase C delta
VTSCTNDYPHCYHTEAVLFFPFLSCVFDSKFNILSRLKVEDEGYANNKLAAWACIRLDRLQQGYRLIKLMDAKGIATDGLLLVKIEKAVVSVAEKSLLTRSVKLQLIN